MNELHHYLVEVSVKFDIDLDSELIDTDLKSNIYRSFEEKLTEAFSKNAIVTLEDYDWTWDKSHDYIQRMYIDSTLGEDELVPVVKNILDSIESFERSDELLDGTSSYNHHGLDTPPYEEVANRSTYKYDVYVECEILRFFETDGHGDILVETVTKDELKNRAKRHRKKLRGLTTLNPDAGNVEHNIEMFNKMNSPVDGPCNNPVSGPFGGDVGGGEAVGESLNESTTKSLRYQFLDETYEYDELMDIIFSFRDTFDLVGKSKSALINVILNNWDMWDFQDEFESWADSLNKYEPQVEKKVKYGIYIVDPENGPASDTDMPNEVFYAADDEDAKKYLMQWCDKNHVKHANVFPLDDSIEEALRSRKPVLYVIKDSHGNILSAPNVDDEELWDRVSSMEARGRRGLCVVAFTPDMAKDKLTEDAVDLDVDDLDEDENVFMEKYDFVNADTDYTKEVGLSDYFESMNKEDNE